MRQVFRWMLGVLLLCGCAAGTRGGDGAAEARAAEARADFDEATRLKGAGKYPEATVRAEHALSLQEAVSGPHHPDVARCLTLLGDLYRRRGEMDHAESVLVRALAIHEAALGKDHPDVAQTLNTLAIVYRLQGQYDRAEPLYRRALAIREAALGPEHPDVAQSLTGLADLYENRGQYDLAEPLYLRGLAIREAALGKDHPDIAQSANNLAIVYMWQGLFGRAEPLYQRALTILERTLGADHPYIAQILNNLAIIYQNQGQYDRAEPILLRSLAIREAALGKSHPDVAQTLTNLANAYKAQRRFDQAEPLYQRALAIDRESLGEEHPLVGTTLNNLANLYIQQKQYARAEPLYQRALAIREAALGENHPDVAQSLNNLAGLYEEQGQYDRAEPLYHRALAIKAVTLGGDHPDLALTLFNIALLRVRQGRLADALPLYTRFFDISELRLRREALDFSESRLATFLQFLREDEQVLYSLLRTHLEDAGVRRLALTTALLLKGRSAEETAHISRTLYRELGPEDRATFERLRSLRTQLAALSLAGPGSESPEEYQARLKSLATEGDTLEAILATRSASLRALTALPPSAEIVDRVAAALPRDGALVELLAFESSSFSLGTDSPPGTTRPTPRYLALVLFPDASIRAVDLGLAEPIDRAATRLRNALANREAAFLAAAQELHRLAFQPLRAALGSTRRVFLSPDGQLGLVPFAALHDGRRFLLDTHDFSYLTSGKELLPRTQQDAPASSVFVLADPDFTAAPPVATVAASAPADTRAAPREDFSTVRASLPRSAWVPLPGTREEAESIRRLLPQAQLFLGPEATKERLLSLPTPGILHLATHGFFLEDDSKPSPGSRGLVHFGGLADNAQAPPQEPLLRSGLALAGARVGVSDAPGAPSRPDASLVTALELAGLDLWGTELVVLSACDTGRGDVQLGQGVSGLRRSLVVAGAETVVMSLWKVRDDSTHLLMEAYYRNLLAGQGRASALREAMRTVRATRPHPHDWAPFIALGSDAPLRAIVPAAPRP